MEEQVGVTVSIGLAANRLMAKIAAGRDKPRGFCVIGSEAAALLAPEPVGLLPGVGPALTRRLAAKGITRLGQLAALSPAEAVRDARRGRAGAGPPAPAARILARSTRSGRPSRSAPRRRSTPTLATVAELERPLWGLCEKLARRLREKELSAAGVVLKLKTASFASRTRAARLPGPTALPDALFAAARGLLAREADGRTRFRLIGVGASPLAALADADRGDLADPDAARRVARQQAVDALRRRYGDTVIGRGRGL